MHSGNSNLHFTGLARTRGISTVRGQHSAWHQVWPQLGESLLLRFIFSPWIVTLVQSHQLHDLPDICSFFLWSNKYLLKSEWRQRRWPLKLWLDPIGVRSSNPSPSSAQHPLTQHPGKGGLAESRVQSWHQQHIQLQGLSLGHELLLTLLHGQ